MYFDAYCAGAEKWLGRDLHDQTYATSLRERRETYTLTKNGGFRVFADQESRKRIGHRQPWTGLFVEPALRDDGRD